MRFSLGGCPISVTVEFGTSFDLLWVLVPVDRAGCVVAHGPPRGDSDLPADRARAEGARCGADAAAAVHRVPSIFASRFALEPSARERCPIEAPGMPGGPT